MARTLAQAQADLDLAYQARRDVWQGKSVRVDTSAGSRSVTTENLDLIEESIVKLEREVAQLEAASAGVTGDPNVRLATWT